MGNTSTATRLDRRTLAIQKFSKLVRFCSTGESPVSANDGIDLIAEEVVKYWKDTGVRYDPVNNNCHKFANDLCRKLCGKGFLQVQSNTPGDAMPYLVENVVDVVCSALPPVLSQTYWLLSRPNVWAVMFGGKIGDFLIWCIRNIF